MTLTDKVDFDAIKRDEALLVSVVQRQFPALRPRYNGYGVPVGNEGDSLSVYQDAKGWHWKRHSTGQGGDVLDFLVEYEGAKNVREAAAMLDRLPPPRPVRRRERPKRPPAPWTFRPESYVARFEGHPQRVALWQAYKPLSEATIKRWRLGVGVLPATICKHERLIYPVFVGGQLVALRGRAVSCGCPFEEPADCRAANGGECPHCPKWLSAGGSQAALWNADALGPNGRVKVCRLPLVVTENPVDGMLLMERQKDVVAAGPTAGANTWKQEWTDLIAASDPPYVWVWYDNDLAGDPNPETHRLLLAIWARKHPGKKPPQPAGPRVLNALLLAGVNAAGAEWQKGTPVHADMGWFLTQGPGRVG